MSNFIQVTPFIVLRDLEGALTFFTEILGFKTLFRAANYAYVQRETWASAFSKKPGRTRRLPAPGASHITLMSTMLTYSTPSSSGNSILCPKATSMDRLTRATANASCSCLLPTATSSPSAMPFKKNRIRDSVRLQKEYRPKRKSAHPRGVCRLYGRLLLFLGCCCLCRRSVLRFGESLVDDFV